MISTTGFTLPNLGQIPDWANWVGLIATFAGFFVSLIGLIATYKEAKEAKDAAKSAEEIARQAINKLQNRNLLLGISTTNSQIQSIKDYVTTDNLLAARTLFYMCSKTIRDVMFHPGDAASNSRMDVVLKEISATLDAASITETKRKAVLRSLREISDRMTVEETKRKWTE